MYATLIIPYNGYTRIQLIEKIQYKWSVELLGCGKIIEVYEDEFIKD